MDGGTIGVLIAGAVVVFALATGWLFVRGIGEVLDLATGHREIER